jgi:hypothetical protein
VLCKRVFAASGRGGSETFGYLKRSQDLKLSHQGTLGNREIDVQSPGLLASFGGLLRYCRGCF